MEVILKKTKITKSIFDQSLIGSPTLLYTYHEYDLLGWCMVKNNRYFLLYHRDRKQVIKIYYISQSTKDVSINVESTQVSDPQNEKSWIFIPLHKISIYFVDQRSTFSITQEVNESDESINAKLTKIKDLIRTIHVAGQIYI